VQYLHRLDRPVCRALERWPVLVRNGPAEGGLYWIAHQTAPHNSSRPKPATANRRAALQFNVVSVE
jgi:hypothetical protein